MTGGGKEWKERMRSQGREEEEEKRREEMRRKKEGKTQDHRQRQERKD